MARCILIAASVLAQAATGAENEGQAMIDFAQAVGALGPTTLLALGFIGFWVALQKRWLITGAHYSALEDRLKDVTEQRDRLFDLALENADIAKTVISKAKVTPTTKRTGAGG